MALFSSSSSAFYFRSVIDILFPLAKHGASPPDLSPLLAFSVDREQTPLLHRRNALDGAVGRFPSRLNSRRLRVLWPRTRLPPKVQFPVFSSPPNPADPRTAGTPR